MNAAPINTEAVTAALRDFQDPETGRSVVEMEQVVEIDASDERIALTLELTTHSALIRDDVYAECEQVLRTAFPDATIEVRRAVHQRPALPVGQIGLTAKSVIAVGSGKGGVGKSTVAASLAYGLNRAGCQVGLLDADVFGPSIPHLTGTSSSRADLGGEDGKLRPVMSDGMPIMSIGYMVPPDQAVIWRGPMLHSAVTQFLRDTDWGDLDYLIIDMPPGTGDVPLTLSQSLPLTGAVVVCTPQDVALLDAVKAIGMFRKVNIPIAGMVENMSGFVCPDCNKRYDIFGSGGARKKAEEVDTPFLGEIPINIRIRTNGDEGDTDANHDDEMTASHFREIGYQLVKNLAETTRRSPPGPSLPVLG
ncbi:MAG: Mrp/NBP35 family ATP-binding protein [Pirellulaceae bacterium]|nr:Mrp/NBP35 family ATP-binding protein [Pirellulaceae bacterium]